MTTINDPSYFEFDVADFPNLDNATLREYVMDDIIVPQPNRAKVTSEWLRENRGDDWVLRELGVCAFVAFCENLACDIFKVTVVEELRSELLEAQLNACKYKLSMTSLEAMQLKNDNKILQGRLLNTKQEADFAENTYITGAQYMWREHNKLCSNLIVFLTTITFGFPLLLILIGTPHWIAGEPKSLILFFDFGGAAVLFLVASAILSVFIYWFVRRRSHDKTMKRAERWHARNKHLLEKTPLE